MGKNTKGSNAKRTPSQNHCSTGESLTTTQRYKKQCWFKRLFTEVTTVIKYYLLQVYSLFIYSLKKLNDDK